MNNIFVNLWNNEVGKVTWDEVENLASFQYSPDFIKSGIQLSPLVMPLRPEPYIFPNLERQTFSGLPGLLADSLPDKFGSKVIDAWVKSEGYECGRPNPVAKLTLIGNRGLGALEYDPALWEFQSNNNAKIADLVNWSNKILGQHSSITEELLTKKEQELLYRFLLVSISAGGSRAKATVAWNPKKDRFLYNQNFLPRGYEHWLIKLDGICGNRDKEQDDPQGFGKIEYAYYLMAREAGIKMSECRLYNENGRSHFLTKRFDRNKDGSKIHMQSLCAIAHMDFNQAGRYSYEDAIRVMKHLNLPQKDLKQFVLRAMFNVVGRNQDDHVKNIAFLMSPSGQWRLSPAFDMTFAYDPSGQWTSQHQMSINGKRDNFIIEDLIMLAKNCGINANHAKEMLERVIQEIHYWPEYADELGIDELCIRKIQTTHRLRIF